MFSNTVVSVEGLDDLLWQRHNAEYRYAGWCHKQMVVLMDFLVEKSQWGEEGGVVILFFLWELRRKGVLPSTTRRRSKRSVGAALARLKPLPNGSLSRDEGSKKRGRKNVNLYRNFRLSGQLIERSALLKGEYFLLPNRFFVNNCPRQSVLENHQKNVFFTKQTFWVIAWQSILVT